MKIELEVKYCSECPFGKVMADPDPYDWFCDDDKKVVCKKLNKEIYGALRPYEVGKIDAVPDCCPFNKK